MINSKQNQNNETHSSKGKLQRIIRAHPEKWHAVKALCEQNHVEYTIDFHEGMYLFTIDDGQFYRIKDYFRSYDDMKNGNADRTPRADGEERKEGLLEKIGAAESRIKGNCHITTPRNEGRRENISSEPTVSEWTKRQEKSGFGISESSRSEVDQNLARAVSQPSERSPVEQKIIPAKDLTKDFGVLTIEEQKRLAERQLKPEPVKHPKLDRVKTGRDYQVKTRLNEAEMTLFRERVKLSGMKQGDFMRACILNEEINIRTMTDIDALAYGKIMEISSNLGRIGGMLRGIIIHGKNNPEILSPTEKADLEREIRDIKMVKTELRKVVKWLYGDT